MRWTEHEAPAEPANAARLRIRPPALSPVGQSTHRMHLSLRGIRQGLWKNGVSPIPAA